MALFHKGEVGTNHEQVHRPKPKLRQGRAPTSFTEARRRSHGAAKGERYPAPAMAHLDSEKRGDAVLPHG